MTQAIKKFNIDAKDNIMKECLNVYRVIEGWCFVVGG